MKKGSFILVLHSHIPYVRKKGKWPHGEETLFEAMAETYIPLLNALYELIQEGYHPKLTISITPILMEQLSDKYIKSEFTRYLEGKIKTCKEDMKIYSGPVVIKDPLDRHNHKNIAYFYLKYYSNILKSFKTKYKKDIIKAFKHLQEKKVLEIITSSATHAYLPLYYDEDAIREQLKVGVNTYKKYFGQLPKGIWLPECGYRPLVKKGKNKFIGFEEHLEEYKLRYFFSDSNALHSITNQPSTSPSLVGLYNYYGISCNPAISTESKKASKVNEVLSSDATVYNPLKVSRSDIAVFARDHNTSFQVWSGEFGYPGDRYYREFHAKDSISGLQYCKVTDRSGIGHKELYEPDKALERISDHADHFVNMIESRIENIHKEKKDSTLASEKISIVSAFDTELFGHWWFEGIEWIKEVMKRFEKSRLIEIDTAGDYISRKAQMKSVRLPENSWGLGGNNYIWMNEQTEWIWPIIHKLSREMKKASIDFPDAKGIKKDILNQALREFLLLGASDWPFLISTNQAKDYATKRILDHKDACEKLLYLAYNRKRLSIDDKTFLRQIREVDNPFKDLDYRKFGKNT